MINIKQAIIVGDLGYLQENLDASKVNILIGLDQYSFLTLSCIYGHYEIAQYLIELGAFINQKSGKEKITPLISCVLHNKEKILNMLVEKEDLDYNIQDKNGMTALMYAVKVDDLNLSNILSDKTDLSISNRYGDTVHYFVKNDRMAELISSNEKGSFNLSR